jgi:CubicO group peptidase (beta-lactamase class C family)
LISHPVSRYLPSFKETTVAEDREGGGYEIVPAKRQVTLRDLLTHTAGVSYGEGQTAHLWNQAEIQGWYFANRDEPVRATIDRLAALPFDAHPGEQWIYGYSTDILGAVVEVVSGKPLDEFLRTRIFEPLGMSDTQFYLSPGEADRLATVYSAADDGLERAPDPGHMVGQGNYVNGPRRSFSGGAGLLSTAHDYSRFLQMMLAGGELDGTRILSRKTVELMTTNHVGDKMSVAGIGFGLGYRVVLDVGAMGEHSSVGEFGWGGAYHSTYWVDPSEELVVVYMTQLIPSGGLDDQQTLRALVYSAIVD